MYAYAPDQLVNTEDVDISISFCIYPKNILQLCTQLFGRFLVVKENWKKIILKHNIGILTQLVQKDFEHYDKIH